MNMDTDGIQGLQTFIGWSLVLFLIFLLVTWPLRRRVRELRRREPWSLERAMWAQSGVFLTGRIVRKWGRQTPTGKRQEWK